MYRGVNQYIYIYIYIFTVNPKRNAGIDRYRNILFQWPNRNGCRNRIYNFGWYASLATDSIFGWDDLATQFVKKFFAIDDRVTVAYFGRKKQ